MRKVKLCNRLVADQKKETLWRCGFKFRLKESFPTRRSLLIQAYVPVSFEFESDVDRASVPFMVKNKPTPGTSTYTYGADQIHAEFMDQTAKCIRYRPMSFDELSGNTVRENASVRIRQQLKREKKKGRGAK